MKKQELIHLHGLLSEVADKVEEEKSGEIDLSNYESEGVRPTSIHKSKTDHKSAVFTLADDITSEMAHEDEERIPAAD